MSNIQKYLIFGGGALLIIIVIIFLITSCGKKNTNNQPGSNTLTIWNLYDEKSAFNEAINDFQKANNIKVNYVKKDPATYLTDSTNAIASGNGPDVWAVPNDWLPKYHAMMTALPTGKIADEKTKKDDLEVYKESYPAVVAQDNIIDNKIYGMPLAIDTLVLYYNTAIFSDVLADYQKTHPDENTENVRSVLTKGPKNWDEFVQAVRLITQKSGDQIQQSAVALGTKDNVNHSVDILTMLMLQNGAKMTSDDLTSAQFQTKQNIFGGVDFPGTKALEFYTSFAKANNDNYTWNSSESDSLHAFAEKKTAMMIDYSQARDEIKKINPDLQFEMISVPQIKETKNPVNYASYMTFTVSKASKNSDLAWKFINFVTKGTYANLYRTETKKTLARMENLNNAPDAVSQEAITAKSWYKPDPDKGNTIFKDMIQQVNEGKNSQTAIENAASQITTLLGVLKQ